MFNTVSSPVDHVVTEPRLPPELERSIFEIAALLRPTDIPALLRIAWRVKLWIEPLLYRAIFLSFTLDASEREGFPEIPLDTLLKKISTEAGSLVPSSVRHIFLELEEDQKISAVEAILAACPGVTNIFVLDDLTPEYLPILSRLPCLLRLTIDVPPLFSPGVIDFGAPLFRNLTHLELVDGSRDLPSDIGLIPNLTHIAFNIDSGIATLHGRIQANAQLRCIAFLHTSVALAETSPISEDTRFLCIRQTNFRADWIRGATIGVDYWALADAFIAAKQAGKVDRSQYCISDTDRNPSWWA
ncbi:hypothetical protein MVEN_00296400 [Mycena venus]|uniref:Uncharacterized protein n=1 Tax=Mycena venus TaxID=2733690 RepID=A0A8H7DBS3_9AGAR|nr:hypothetical protein MVEN_00296400 [Mycena venus]